MSIAAGSGLSDETRIVHAHYRQLLRTRRLYSFIAIAGIGLVLVAALWFANASNAGKFFDRLPYFFDFLLSFAPD